MDKITSLSEYLNFTSKYTKKIFYRGECADFGDSACVAKANRSLENYRKYYQRMEIFERKVREASLLNECDPLIPFAQHNGLATRLLDISSNPLVALYFACQGKEEDTGYIYVFDDYADATELLKKYPSFDLEEELLKHVTLLNSQNILKLNDMDDGEVKYPKIEHDELEVFSKCIEQYRQKYVEGGYQRHALARFTSASDSPFTMKAESLRLILEAIRKSFLTLCEKNLALNRAFLPKNYSSKTPTIDVIHPYGKNRYHYYNQQYKSFDLEVKEYLISLECLIAYIYDKSAFGNIASLSMFDDLTMDFIPNLLYQPIMTFKRGISQQSSFFLQPLFYKHEFRMIDPMTEETQRENPAQLFKCQANHINKIIVDGKSKVLILDELDRVGVNKATIFGDSDNIADYIMNLKEL